MKLIFVLLTVSMLFSGAAHADLAKSSHELGLIQHFMLSKDYPEKFKGNSYHVELRDAVVAPVLNDGSHDVVILVTPTYRQSATVLIYEIAKDDSVSRVTEGLAPGPLVAVSGDYIDSHTLGDAVDVAAPDEKQHPGATAKIISAGIANFGGFVAYRSFFHGDGRMGAPWFIDMSGVDSPLEGDNCSKFEFSKVDEIAAGTLDGAGDKTYLAARMGHQLYLYLIGGLRDGKFLNKTVWVSDLPGDFKRFAPGDPSTIHYLTQEGQSKPLAAP